MYLLAKVVTVLISPLCTALVLGAVGLLCAYRGLRRMGAGLGAVALLWLGLWSLPVVSTWLRGSIEQQYPQQALSAVPRAEAIVVLGGAMVPPANGTTESDLGSAADRVWYAARLYHAGKAPLLILSGGYDPHVHKFSEAQAMALFLRDLGVPPQAIVLEEQSRTTRDNAVFTARVLKERGLRRALLVTSALHMPRALALFRRQGMDIEPAPTDVEVRPMPSDILAWLPDAEALSGSARAIKEVVGRMASK